MDIERYDEPHFLAWSFRYGVPAVAWALLFAFFAFAGWVSSGDPVVASAGQPGTTTARIEATPRPSASASEMRPTGSAAAAIALGDPAHPAGAAQPARR